MPGYVEDYMRERRHAARQQLFERSQREKITESHKQRQVVKPEKEGQAIRQRESTGPRMRV